MDRNAPVLADLVDRALGQRRPDRGRRGNPRDGELDILLLSATDGQVIRNLTRGLDKDRGFEYISTPGGLRGNLVPWIAWAPVGDRLAYFVRTEKERTLIVQNVVSGKVERRFPLKTINGPESPAFSPDAEMLVFSAMSGGQADLFTIDLNSGALKNVTNDPIADYSPAYAPDAKSIVYTSRTGSNDKLFRIDLATGAKKQITFGGHDDDGARFYDDHTLIFSSTATDPSVSIPAAVARNGNIPNVWTLDLQTNQLRQWTDTATGNVSPIVLRQSGGPRVAFVSYYKGTNALSVISSDKPVAVVGSDDFGGRGKRSTSRRRSATLGARNIGRRRFRRAPAAAGGARGGNRALYRNQILTTCRKGGFYHAM